MDPNDGSQGGFSGGNMSPYQGGYNSFMYSYQGQPYWLEMSQLPQGMPRLPQGMPQLPQGMSRLPSNFSMMHPQLFDPAEMENAALQPTGPQLFHPAEMENASLQPNQDDVDNLSVSAAPSGTGKRSSEGTRIKQSNFKPHEDINLVRSWLEIQGDQITNTSQKKMWHRILERYNSRREADPERSWKSLQSRWDTIRAEMGKFASYYAKVLRENRSGMSDSDKTSQAAANFADIEKRQFCYLHYWDIMKDEPKWQDVQSRANLRSAAGEGFGEDNMNLGDGNSSPIRAAEKRPMGRDKAKAAKKSANSSGGGGGSASSSEYASRMEDLSLQRNSIMQEESLRRIERFQNLERIDEYRFQQLQSHNAAMVAIEKEKIELMREQHAKELEAKEKEDDERILAKELEKVTPPSLRAYYQIRQAEILEKLSARRRKRPNPEP